jgi:AraC-like DNA-binding protein
MAKWSPIYRSCPYGIGVFLVTHKEDFIEDIARQCGYSTASHFGKIFKETYGMTQGSLREQ